MTCHAAGSRGGSNTSDATTTHSFKTRVNGATRFHFPIFAFALYSRRIQHGGGAGRECLTAAAAAPDFSVSTR